MENSHLPPHVKPSVLLVSSMPPARCGVATYAAEHLDAMLAANENVEVISTVNDSNASHNFDLSTLCGCWAWLCFCLHASHSRVFLHFTDAHFFPRPSGNRFSRVLGQLLQALALNALSRRIPGSSVIFHELGTGESLPRWFTALRNLAFHRWTELQFHTPSMREASLKHYRYLRPENCLLIDHVAHMRCKFSGTTQEARTKLDLPSDHILFLCLGFITENKGFDDAIHAFNASGVGLKKMVQLHLVGDTPENKSAKNHISKLQMDADASLNVFLHPGFIDDQTFDAWLAACDALILPYRGVASSGVGARASLYDKPLIVRDLPNLIEQFPNAIAFSNAEDLALIISSFAKEKMP